MPAPICGTGPGAAAGADGALHGGRSVGIHPGKPSSEVLQHTSPSAQQQGMPLAGGNTRAVLLPSASMCTALLHRPTCILTCPLLSLQALGLEQPPDVLGWLLGGGVAVAMAARHGEQLGRASGAGWNIYLHCHTCFLFSCVKRRMALRRSAATRWLDHRTTAEACHRHCACFPVLQFVILEGSAGGTGSVPPTPRALRILSSTNTTETLALSLLFPLNTTQGALEKAVCWLPSRLQVGLLGASAADAHATHGMQQTVRDGVSRAFCCANHSASAHRWDAQLQLLVPLLATVFAPRHRAGLLVWAGPGSRGTEAQHIHPAPAGRLAVLGECSAQQGGSCREFQLAMVKLRRRTCSHVVLKFASRMPAVTDVALGPPGTLCASAAGAWQRGDGPAGQHRQPHAAGGRCGGTTGRMQVFVCSLVGVVPLPLPL